MDDSGNTPPTDAVSATPDPSRQPATAGDDTAATGASKPPYRASYTFLVVLTVINLVVDLWSKHWAKSTFEAMAVGRSRKVVVIDGVMNFIYAQNPGGAWGMLQRVDESVRRPFFLAVSVAAIVFIVSLYRKLRPGQTVLKWGLPLVLGGALGNLIDRIRFGFVVDFIDVVYSWGGHATHWPTFNVADVSICVGVVLMGIDMFIARPPKKTAVAAQAAAAAETTAAASAAEPAASDAG